MTTLDLQSRLKSLSETNRSISALNTRLFKLAPSLDAEGQGDTAQERVELSTEIHQTLKELEEEFELIKQEAEDYANPGTSVKRRDSEKDSQRIAIITHVDRLGEDLKLSRTQFRKAQLQAKRNEDTFKRKERELLLTSPQDGTARAAPGKKRGQEKLSQDDLVVNASSDVTSALRRTHQLMQSELDRSEFASETLKNGTAALNQLNESYSTLDGLLSSSRSLIGTLVSSQKSDTWYLETAFWILVSTIGWLIFRRIFYTPINYLLVWPLKTVFGIFLTVARVALSVVVGGSAATTAVSSSRPPLKVQPSASNRPPPRMMSEQASVPVGRGGSRKKEDTQKEPDSLSEQVGRMTDETKEQESSSHDQKESTEGDEAGDGTKLRERQADEKPNPKKRMMEVPPEERTRDEL